MSGIFGAWRPRGAVAPEELGAMRDAARIWGADGEGSWTGDGVVLGHIARRDAPESTPQPLALAEALDVAITADARLHDRDALAAVLGAHRETADAELILRAYLHWGEGCAERLSGEFAFAVWDGRRGTLLCARDHMGLRPLHYWHGPDAFVFGTSADAVLAFEGVPREIDEEALVARLVRNHAVGLERSFFAGVRKVAPGEALVVEPGRLRRSVHWAPGARQALRLADPREYADALRATLEVAVADAVRTVRPVGAHLSGGIDSSSVAVLGQRALQATGAGLTRAYAWSPPFDAGAGIPDDERSRVEEIARGLGVPVSYTHITPEDRIAGVRRTVALEPNTALELESVVMRAAAADGTGVLLSGWGGDELASFNGRGRLTALMLAGRWPTLVREAAAVARRGGASGPAVARGVAVQIIRHAVEPMVPYGVDVATGRGNPGRERRLRAAEGIGWSDVHPRAEALVRDLNHQDDRPVSPRAVQLMLLRRGHLTARVEAWAHAGARHGIDYRYPLLDRRVIDLCLSFPGELWLHAGWRRWVFRQAVSDLLPSEVVWKGSKREPGLDHRAAFATVEEERAALRDAPPELARVVAAAGRVRRGLFELRLARIAAR